MFAKQVNSALCLENYKDLRKGASVPVSNELYAQVEEWLTSNDWAEIPEGFFDVELTTEQRIAEINDRLYQIDIESMRPVRAVLTGNNSVYDDDKLNALNSESFNLRAELRLIKE